MSENVFAFPRHQRGPEPWTDHELAELYRVVDILARAGLATETDMGMSDEGDPWFVFCRADTSDVLAHFARIEGQFVAASTAVADTYKGANFRQIVDSMVRSQPLMLPPPGPGTRPLLQPAVVLTAFVATALAHSERAQAADTLQPVKAKWDFHPTADAAPGIGAQASWFDSIHNMLRNPIADASGNHDGPGNPTGGGEGVSLASLITIAMTAMQPLVEKLSFVPERLAVAMPSHDAAIPAALADSALSMPMIEPAAVKADDAIVVQAGGEALRILGVAGVDLHHPIV